MVQLCPLLVQPEGQLPFLIDLTMEIVNALSENSDVLVRTVPPAGELELRRVDCCEACRRRAGMLQLLERVSD
eukprot:1836292-Prorocentrum_lima.AAC.1